MKAIILFLLLFIVLVTLHEWGHFIVAKKSGVLVREFSIGVGSKIFQWRKNETLYTLRILPLGGYVRMAGRNDMNFTSDKGRKIYIHMTDDAIDAFSEREQIGYHPVVISHWAVPGETLVVQDELTSGTEEYHVCKGATITNQSGVVEVVGRVEQFVESQSVLKRVAIYGMGPLMNILLSVVLFIIVGLSSGVRVDTPIVGMLDPELPFAQAGAQVGDEILAIDGKTINKFSEAQAIISVRGGKESTIEFRRGDEVFTKTLTIKDVDGRGLIGIAPPIERSVGLSIKEGVKTTATLVQTTLKAMVELVTNFDINQLGGPVLMAKSTQQVVSSAKTDADLAIAMITWGGVLSVNLALLNLLPIPALDGGRILFALIEGVRKKAISEDLEFKINVASGLFLMVAFFAITMNDLFFR